MHFNSLHQYMISLIPKSAKIQKSINDFCAKIDANTVFKNGNPKEISNMISDIKHNFTSINGDFIEKMKKIEDTTPEYNVDKIVEICETIYKNVKEDIDYPNVGKFSKERVQKRRELSDRARESFYKSVNIFSSSLNVASNVFDVSSKISRQALTLLGAKSEADFEESTKMAYMLANPSEKNKAERKAFVTKRIIDCIKLTRELKYTYTDEEFIDKFGDRLPDIFLLTELQASNISAIERDFGIELDDSVRNLWQENASILTGCGSYMNKLAFISNKNYAEFDEDAIISFNIFLSNSQIDPDILKNEFGFHLNGTNAHLMENTINTIEHDENLNEGEEPEFTDDVSQKIYDSLGDMIENVPFSAENTVQVIDNEHPKSALVAYNQEMARDLIIFDLKEKFNIEEIKDQIENSDKPYAIFKDLSGNVLTKEEAFDRIVTGKNVMLSDNNGNELRYFSRNSINLNWGTIENPDKYPKFNLESDSVDTIKARFSDLLKDLNEGTHWYMRSSSEYRNLRTSVSELLKTEYDNPSNMLDKINEIKENAKAYIISKEDPNASITKRTEPRIDACNKLINVITNSIQEPRVIENTKLFNADLNLKTMGIDDNLKDVKPILNEKEIDEIEETNTKDIYNDIMKEETRNDSIEIVNPTINENALLSDELDGFEQDVNLDDIENAINLDNDEKSKNNEEEIII